MGHLQAVEYASGEFCDMDTGLYLHLTSNHYPPISARFVPAAKEAIELATAERLDADITLPNGIVRTARQIVEDLHLWPFVEAASE